MVRIVSASRITMGVYFVLVAAVLIAQVQSQDFPFDPQWDPDFQPDTRDTRVTRDQIADGCNGKVADIFFILDSSTSIYVNDYRLELQFARDLIARFDINQRYTRVGLLTFSDDITRPPLELNRYQSKSELLANINEQNLPYRTGVTNTDLALRYVRENRNFRENVVKVIIVVTDGGSRSPWLTTMEAELAREQGFYLFVCGVGQYLEEREWRSVASDPDETFVFNVTAFRNLDNIKLILPPRICTLPPLDVFRQCDVETSADVTFVAAPGGTNEAAQLIYLIDASLNDRGNYIRINYLLDICNNAENVAPGNFNNYCDRQKTPTPAIADTYVQLLSILRALARQSHRGAPQIAVLFLDEESLRLNWYNLASEIRSAWQVGNIQVIVVDVGVRGFVSALQTITHTRDNLITFASGSVSSQRIQINNLISRTCTAINGDRDDFTFPFTPSK